MKYYICIIKFLNTGDEPVILWGDEILADMPSCLGGGDNRIN